MNPFLNSNSDLKLSGNYYADFVLLQVKDMAVADSLRVDLGGKSTPDFRMTLRYVADKKLNGSKFKTKVSKDGALWVKRVV